MTLLHRQIQDTLVSLATTSPCAYAVEPTCTGRFAQWREWSALYSESLLLDSNAIMVYPFIYERVNRYTVNFVVMLTTSATYGKMFLDRKGCGRRWIEALKERGYGWRLRVVCDWQQK